VEPVVGKSPAREKFLRSSGTAFGIGDDFGNSIIVHEIFSRVSDPGTVPRFECQRPMIRFPEKLKKALHLFGMKLKGPGKLKKDHSELISEKLNSLKGAREFAGIRLKVTVVSKFPGKFHTETKIIGHTGGPAFISP
jgi:hypothetical protein